MPELIVPPAPPQVDFTPSLPLNLLLTLALVPAAEEFEGLDEWLREARAALPAGRRRELALLTGFPGGHIRFVEAVAAETLGTDEQAQSDWPAWRGRLDALPPAAFQTMALNALRRGLAEETVATADLRAPDYLRAFLLARDPERDPAPVLALVLKPQRLQERFLGILDHFWEQLYRPVYQAGRPLMERSVAYHRAQAYPPHFDQLFMAVTGRVIPAEVQALQTEIRQARFVPSCHLGPYVAFFRQGDRLIVFYNCRGTLLAERQAGEQVRHLYPLLKALADETRLQILALLREREMYAQEMVEQLGLSQPAISRHLKLLVAAGILQVRPEGGAKYYLPDREALRQMLDELGELFWRP